MATITKPQARGQVKQSAAGKAGSAKAVAGKIGPASVPAVELSGSSDAATERSAVVWATLGYVAGKEGDRDSLTDGAAYSVGLTIVGTIDGQRVAERIEGRLTVGHSSEKASSSTPNVAHIIAAILAKLNKTTREKVLRELPAEYAAGGQSLPGLAVGDVAEAENLLGLLRQTKRVVARGPVKCEYDRETVEHEAVEAVAVAGVMGGEEAMAGAGGSEAADLSVFGVGE